MPLFDITACMHFLWFCTFCSIEAVCKHNLTPLKPFFSPSFCLYSLSVSDFLAIKVKKQQERLNPSFLNYFSLNWKCPAVYVFSSSSRHFLPDPFTEKYNLENYSPTHLACVSAVWNVINAQLFLFVFHLPAVCLCLYIIQAPLIWTNVLQEQHFAAALNISFLWLLLAGPPCCLGLTAGHLPASSFMSDKTFLSCLKFQSSWFYNTWRGWC